MQGCERRAGGVRELSLGCEELYSFRPRARRSSLAPLFPPTRAARTCRDHSPRCRSRTTTRVVPSRLVYAYYEIIALCTRRERVARRGARIFARERHRLFADATVSPPRLRARDRFRFQRRRLASRASQRLLRLVHRLRRARQPIVPRAPIDRRGDPAETVRLPSTASAPAPATLKRRRRVRRPSRRPRRVPRDRRHRHSRVYQSVQRVVPARSRRVRTSRSRSSAPTR